MPALIDGARRDLAALRRERAVAEVECAEARARLDAKMAEAALPIYAAGPMDLPELKTPSRFVVITAIACGLGVGLLCWIQIFREEHRMSAPFEPPEAPMCHAR